MRPAVNQEDKLKMTKLLERFKLSLETGEIVHTI